MLNLDSLIIQKAGFSRSAEAKTPERGAARYFYLVYVHFAKLVGINMLFLLFCIPVVTIPAALSGMNRVCILLFRDGTCSVWHDFINEFKSSFFKSMPLGLLCAFLFADAALCVFLGIMAGAAVPMIVLLIAALLLFIAALLLSSYIFVIMPLLSLKGKDILRDAVILMLLQPKANMLILLCVGGGITAAVLFLPFSVPIIGVIGMGLLSLAACAILNDPIEKTLTTMSIE